MPMFSIPCCTGGIAEQLGSLHTLSSPSVLAIHQNSSCNIVANRSSDSKYTGPFSRALFGASMFIARIRHFFGVVNGSFASSEDIPRYVVNKKSAS